MATANFNAQDFAEMERIAKQLESFSEEYERIANELLTRASTMGTAWEGDDNAAFVAQISGLKDDLKLMASKLDEAGKSVRTQKEQYMNQQSQNIEVVKKLQN